MAAQTPFLENQVFTDYGQMIFDGILGLSPIDESSGPLYLDTLY